MKKKIILIILAILLITSCLLFINKTEYKKYSINFQKKHCTFYYEKCTCYGSLTIMEIEPPKYSCFGLNLCQDINETICR
jgi:hypothetical protein